MTTWWGWAGRRASASRLLLGTLLGLVTVTTLILAFTVGHAGSLATDAARAALTSAEPGAGAVQAQTRIGDDVAAQDRTAREQLTEGFAPAPVTILTTHVSEPRPAEGIDGRITLWSGAHLSPGLLSVTDGTWPDSPDEAALQASAAAGLGITPGESLTVDGHALVVTALWEVTEPSHPLWFGDPLVTVGADATSVGPLITDATALSGGAPFIRWSVVPDVERITADQLDVLAEGADRAKALVEAADQTGRGIVVAGDLSSTAERAGRDWSVGRAFGIVPVSVLVLVAGVGLVQVSGLLAGARRREHQLLAARGAGRRQLIVSGLVEATAVALAGAGLGTAIAVAALRLATGSTAEIGSVLLGGLGSLILTLLCLWTVTIRGASSLGGGPRADRVRAVAGSAALLVVFTAAAVTTWQLRRSPDFALVPALSPAFLLAAAAVLGLVALGPVTRVVEAVTRRRGADLWLAGAQLARGLLVHAVAATLTILSTGTATFAALYAGTAAATHRDLSTLAAGAPLRATLSGLDADLTALSLPDLAAVDGVGGAVPVWLDESARVGDTAVVAVAAPLDLLAGVASLPTGVELPDLPQRPDPVPPIAIPDGTATLRVELSGRLTLDAWQQLYFDRVEEINRAGFDVLDADAESLVRFWSDEYYRTIATPVTFSSRIILRDRATGLARSVPGPTLALDSPDGEDAGPFDRPTFLPLAGEGAVDIPLPARGDHVVEGFSLIAPQETGGDRTAEVSITLLADGEPLGGAEQWTSDQAVSFELAAPYRQAAAALEPSWETHVDVIDFGNGTSQTLRRVTSNRPPSPRAVIDTSEPTWRLVASPIPQSISIGPGVPFTGEDPESVMDAAAPGRTEPIPVAITQDVGDASTLGVGSSFDLAAFGRRFPAVVAEVIRAVPGVTAPRGVIVDANAVSGYLSTTTSALRWPSELWASTDGDPAAARASAARLPGIGSARIAPEAPARTATAARSLWIAAGSALLLSLTGLAAAAATQLGARRSEVAVLRALGMTPARQSRSRVWETGGVLAVATAAGLAAGWGVSWLTVEPTVRAASDQSIRLGSPLTAEIAPLFALLGAGALIVGVILWLLAAAVRRQALDHEYREEVR